MPTPASLEEYIARRYGNGGSLMVRDPETDLGWRLWSQEDSKELCQWLAGNGNGADTNDIKPKRICHNQDQAAQVAGVGSQTVRNWLERKEHALPHIRDGRRILIPHFMLVRWIKEEAERNTRKN